MSKKDYYEILGVGRNATEQELKSAYKRQAVRYHPDKNPGDAEAEAKFKEVAEAYSVLSNAEQRARYDRYGHAGVSGSAGANWGAQGFGGIEDILGDLFGFGDVFGGGRATGSRRSSAQRGADLRYDLEITLEEAAEGMTAQLRIPRLETCDTCTGTGAQSGTQPEICSTCSGAGQVRYQQGFFSVARTCGACRGTGRIDQEPVRDVQGAGRVERERQMEVKVPAGVETGSRLRITGEGEGGAQGGTAGDLYVVIHVKGARAVRAAGQQSLRGRARDVRAGRARLRDHGQDPERRAASEDSGGHADRARSSASEATACRCSAGAGTATSSSPSRSAPRPRSRANSVASSKNSPKIEDRDLEDKGLMDRVRDIFG
jgi:molecular chaperone DnaJ